MDKDKEYYYRCRTCGRMAKRPFDTCPHCMTHAISKLVFPGDLDPITACAMVNPAGLILATEELMKDLMP